MKVDRASGGQTPFVRRRGSQLAAVVTQHAVLSKGFAEQLRRDTPVLSRVVVEFLSIPTARGMCRPDLYRPRFLLHSLAVPEKDCLALVSHWTPFDDVAYPVPRRRCARLAYGRLVYCWQHSKIARELSAQFDELHPGAAHVKQRTAECLEAQEAGVHCAPCLCCAFVRYSLDHPPAG